ncbi:MAG TPA: hypothetical protein QGG32_11495 [Rhodospirillales bacterium]|nr:hypothetical protein [Rhodospirillales bacterium]
MDVQRRTLLLSGIAADALGSAGLLGAGISLAPSARFAQGFRRIEGKIQINGLLVQVGTPVQAGDVLTAGPDGLATLVIGNDASSLARRPRHAFPALPLGYASSR